MSSFFTIIILFNNVIGILYYTSNRIWNLSFLCVIKERKFFNKDVKQFYRIDIVSSFQVIQITIINNSLLNNFYN